MPEILILEAEERNRLLLRTFLEGINYHIQMVDSREHIPVWEMGRGPDLVILGVHLELEGEDALNDWPIWQKALPDAPVLVLFSGNPLIRKLYLKHWSHTMGVKCLEQPVQPYPFLAMVKAMISDPDTWRRRGQQA